MKHCRIKNTVRTVCFLLVFAFVLGNACRLFEKKDSVEMYSEFWENPKEYDVWFFGTSHMRYGVQPMDLWNDYHIRSYNLAAPSSYLPQVYWTLRNALDYAAPKVVVVDCYHVEGNTKTWADDRIEKVHTGFDSIPFSPTKLRAVFDIFDTTEERIEYLFGFYSYHNRWEELGNRDFSPAYSISKGSFLSDIVSGPFRHKTVPEAKASKEEALGHAYLRKIIEECQKRDIPLVLTAIPSHTKKTVQLALNKIPEIAKEYDVPFLNMIYDESLALDYPTDFQDIGHLNKAGAKKATRYMGDYLTERFDLTKDLKEDTIQEWDNDYMRFQTEIKRSLNQISSLSGYLMWMAEEAYSVSIYLNDDFAIKNAAFLEPLLKRLPDCASVSLEEIKELPGMEYTECNGQEDAVIFVRDPLTKEVIDTAVFQDDARQR